MRFLFLPARLAAGLVLLLSSAFAQSGDETVDWHNNYREALQEARQTGKPIFLEYRCEP